MSHKEEITNAEIKQLTIAEKAKELGAPASFADKIEATFSGMANKLREFEPVYSEVVAAYENGNFSDELTAKAKRLRLDIAKVRNKVESERKKGKQPYLDAGRAIDGIANIYKAGSNEMERKLEDIEKHFERLEEEKKARLQSERTAALLKLGFDLSHMDLGTMAEEVYNAFYSAKEKEAEDIKLAQEEAEKARIEAEKKAEEERQRKIKEAQEAAEKARRESEALKERISKLRPYGVSVIPEDLGVWPEDKFKSFLRDACENWEKAQQKAKEAAEAAEKFRNIQISRVSELMKFGFDGANLNLAAMALKDYEAFKAERHKEFIVAQEEKKKQEEKARELAIEAEKKRLKAEADEKERQRIAAEEKEKAERARKAAAAPDKVKIIKLANDLKSFPLPQMGTIEGNAAINDARNLLDKVYNHLIKKANGLG